MGDTQREEGEERETYVDVQQARDEQQQIHVRAQQPHARVRDGHKAARTEALRMK